MWSVLFNQNITIPFIIQWGPAPLHQDSEDDGDYDQKDDNAENTDGDDGTRVDFLLLTPGDVSILISSVRLMLIVRVITSAVGGVSHAGHADPAPDPGDLTHGPHLAGVLCNMCNVSSRQPWPALPHITRVITYQSRSYKIPADIDKKPQPATEQYKRC